MKTNLPTIIFLALVTKSFSADSQSANDLRQLKADRDKAIAESMAPINRRYQAGLEQLLRRATQANDLEAALKIKQEIDQISPTVHTIVGTWHFENNVREFRADGTVAFAGSKGKNSWKAYDDKIVLTYSNGYADTFFLPILPEGTKVRCGDGREMMAVKQK